MSVQSSVKLESSGVSAIIEPHGAQMVSFKTAKGQELVWQGDPASWPDHSLILFPVVGPLVGGVFRHGGAEYPMPPHGFALMRDFSLVEQRTDRCVFELGDDGDTRLQYPFDFLLQVRFELSGASFLQTITVENLGSGPMPADVGFHPGFNWPLTPGLAKDDYLLTFEKDEPAPIRRGTGDPIFLLPDGRPTPVEGNVLRLRDELFVELPIVFDRLNSRSLTYGAPGSLSLLIDFPDSPSLGLWMIPGTQFLCIEPWQGYPSLTDFNGPFMEKPGTAIISAGETRSWRLGLTVTTT